MIFEPLISESSALAIITIAITAASAFAAWITSHYEKKGHNLNALIEVFKVLNDAKHRGARRRVYKLYDIEDSTEIKKILEGLGATPKNLKDAENNALESKAMVKADLDQMGALIRNKVIPKKEFLELYWHTILLCWKALYEDIQEERNNRKNPKYMEYFEGLKKEAEKHWHSKHCEIKSIEIYK